MECRAFPGRTLAPAHWLIGLAALLLTGWAGAADEIYRTVDADGAVVYSDHPLSASSERISAHASEPSKDEAARLAKEQELQKTEVANQAKQVQQAAAQQQKQADKEWADQQLCAEARNRYATFSVGGRIYHLDAQGERVYYSDEELAQELTAAKAAMDSVCSR